MQEERYGTRDMTYSNWHRRYSTQRFVTMEYAQLLAMIDLDGHLYVEYDDGSKEPLMLVETAIDVGQDYKCASVTRNLALRANIPAFLVFYKIASKSLSNGYNDIEQFRVLQIAPFFGNWCILSPDQWAKFLLQIRRTESKKIDLAKFVLTHTVPF